MESCKTSADFRQQKEPSNLILQNGKRPDGRTLIPLSRGKLMARDVTVPDIYVESRIGDTARGRRSGQPGSGQHAHLLPSCHRNRRYLESLDCWACPGNRQTGHINHWRTWRIHLSISAVVNSPPKGKCGRLPQHVWLRLDAAAVIPCLVQRLKPVALC